MSNIMVEKETARELAYCSVGDEYEGYTVMENEICDRSRWTVDYFLVVQYEGKFYATCYSRGATEMQEEYPFKYDDDEVKFGEVVPVERTVIEYVSPDKADV